jgi:hypothetical protein
VNIHNNQYTDFRLADDILVKAMRKLINILVSDFNYVEILSYIASSSFVLINKSSLGFKIMFRF